MPKFLVCGWLIGLMLLLIGPSGAVEPGHGVLASDLDRLRADFNADVGQVRAVLLAAPT